MSIAVVAEDNERLSIDDLPYNNDNILLNTKDIQSILKEYDIVEKINDINLYRQSFVHKSYCTRKNENFLNGNINCPDNCIPLQEISYERLEFLGDSILSMVIANYLFERYIDEDEGFLTKLRTKLVNGKMLAFLSKKIGLDKYVLISKQIEKNDGRNNLNILEDIFESLIAAIYIDLGFEIAKNWIINIIENHIDFSELIKLNNNYKDIFLKFYQQNHGYIPKFYEMNVETKSNNTKIYTVCIKDNDNNVIAISTGSSRKDAENNVAKIALNQISKT